jgi:hypothetical protein
LMTSRFGSVCSRPVFQQPSLPSNHDPAAESSASCRPLPDRYRISCISL